MSLIIHKAKEVFPVPIDISSCEFIECRPKGQGKAIVKYKRAARHWSDVTCKKCLKKKPKLKLVKPIEELPRGIRTNRSEDFANNPS